jgi:hypothetical protein
MLGLRVIEVRKLAALDMAWLGTRVVLAEYALGVVSPAALGALSLGSGMAGHAELYQWPSRVHRTTRSHTPTSANEMIADWLPSMPFVLDILHQQCTIELDRT